MLRYFEENVYGKGEYGNALGQPFGLFYDSWLEETYGRTGAQKFRDHMGTLDGLQDALDVVGFFWDGADLVNMVISLCRGEPGEALTYLVCAIPVPGSLLGKGGKLLKSAGADLVVKGAAKGEDLVSSLRVTYRAAADRAANLQKYLDDAISQMMAGRTGYGQYRLCFAGGYLDDGSRFVYGIYDDAGNTLSRISRMDDLADSKALKELGGAGHPDDVGDILSAARGLDDVGAPRGLDGSGEGWKVNNYGRVSEGGTGIKYSPVNPGPLSEDVANSFNGATYTERVLTEDTVMYRVSGGNAKEVGPYMSMTPQGGGLQSQLDLALNPAWGNTTENITKVVVPKGTTIYEGIAAPQNIYDSLGNVIGTLPRGGNQVYIPAVEARWFQ